MRRFRLPVIPIIAAAVLSSYPGELPAQKQERAPGRDVYIPPEEGGGFILPSMDLSYLKPSKEYLMSLMQPPSSWDWRTLNGVTSVKNQNPYGTCWAFASIANLESQVLINDLLAYDYSEYNVISCAPNNLYDEFGFNCNTGGNDRISANYLTRFGTVEESCDPYPGSCPDISCINPGCAFRKQATEWRIIIPDTAYRYTSIIKNAVMNYGPAFTAMYNSWSAFQGYDGTYCLTYSGTQYPNHAVLIVGWDDEMCGGDGAWIAKNSWGTGWGDNGYFYIRYGDARIGSITSVITGFKDFDDREKIYLYDEYGCRWFFTTLPYDQDDWGMIKITPEWSGNLYAVDFWAAGSPTTYTVYVYDDFTGGSLTNLVAGPVSGTVQEAGYYSVELPTPLGISQGDPVFAAVRFQTPGYNYPVPVDVDGTRETGKTYISDNGVTWIDEGVEGYGDIGIRGRALPRCHSIPILDIEIIGMELIDLGMTKFTRFWVEVVNRSEIPDDMLEAAPDLPQACGIVDASRTLAEIFDQDYTVLETFCELTSQDDLDSLYFDVPQYQAPPDSITLGLSDRRCYISYYSDYATLQGCLQPVPATADYTVVSMVDSLWEIQIEIENTGPGGSYDVTASMFEKLAWLTVTDSSCSYGDILEGSSSQGEDTYTMDLTGYTGRPFMVYLNIEYEDACLNQYQITDSLELDPERTESDVTAFKLYQNWPNPFTFTPNTTINYKIPVDCRVSLEIYDVTGKLIRTIIRNEPKYRGHHTEIWDGKDNEGRTVASGIYFYRLQAGSFTDAKKMCLFR